jgi:hypothetical protein
LAVLFHLVKYLGAPEFFADLRPGEEIVAFGSSMRFGDGCYVWSPAALRRAEFLLQDLRRQMRQRILG